LSWHPDIAEPVDPFGLEDEFSQSGPIQPQPTDDSDTQPDDLKWDICPGLNRQWRRKWMAMLRKHRNVFSGPEKRLGKLDSRFDMRIEADAKAIRSKGPYPTSPAKRKIIN